MTARRSDSVRNRTLILAAANDVFAQHGAGAPLDLVADAAGVGRATLYRNFEDRSALLLALFAESMTRLEEKAASVGGRDDALFALLRFSGDHITSRAAMFEQIGALSPDHPALRDARALFLALFKAPLARAIATGLCRADVRVEDMLTISTMLSGAVRGLAPEAREKAGPRALALLLDGLRPR